jgi:hypothetical protein
MSGNDTGAGDRGFTLGESSAPRESESDDERIPKMDFSTFVISLGTSALYYMGVVEGPEGEDPAQMNLPLARQTVDTLEMLAEKARGNLDGQEAKLLESLLFELRMRYVESEK